MTLSPLTSLVVRGRAAELARRLEAAPGSEPLVAALLTTGEQLAADVAPREQFRDEGVRDRSGGQSRGRESAHRLHLRGAGGVQIDHRGVSLGADLTNRLCPRREGVVQFAVDESSTHQRRDQNRPCASLADFGDETFQIVGIGRRQIGGHAFARLVVVAELDQHPSGCVGRVAHFRHGQIPRAVRAIG